MSGEGPKAGDDIQAGSAAGFGTASRVAGYRLEQRIGAGGMAVVYRARDERLGRLVALKILAPGLAADDEFRQRFVRESRAAAAVDDPHIIPVFAAGEAEGVLFIAMRYVPGGDVRTLVHREGPLSPERAAAIISPVASALDAAHAAGLVHRDVKPANMLVDTRAGRPDHVYLADFGLSKGRTSSITLTRAGQSMGTPSYMAPEQIEGRAVDGRTDQYALACVAYELLAGGPPFERDHQEAVIYAQLAAAPPALTSRRPSLPAEVDAVMARALAKAPEYRYPSCREFAEALRRALGLAPYYGGQTATGEGYPPARGGVPPTTGGSSRDVPVGVPADRGTWDVDPEARNPTVTSLPKSVGSGTDAWHPAQPSQPRRSRSRRVPLIAAGTAVVVVAAVVVGITLSGSSPRKPTVHRPPHPTSSVAIAVQSNIGAVDGYSTVRYMAGDNANAEIQGKIKGVASGEVAQLYAQPFPYDSAPTQAGQVTLHPNGKTASYQFQVTPTLATRYKVELLKSSDATKPLATSPVSTIYVIHNFNFTTETLHATCSPTCQVTAKLDYFLPASALGTEMAKKLFVYFGVNLALHKTPPQPKTLILGEGSPQITTQRDSDTEFTETVTFSYQVGQDNSEWRWSACYQDTEAQDGLGLPGRHGCGNESVPVPTPYLG